MHHAVAILESAASALRAGRRVALCAVVNAAGSTPQESGALLLLHDDLRIEGTLGGGCVEAEVRRQALTLLNKREPRLLTFKLDHDYGWDDGLICGGTLKVAVAPLAGQVHLPEIETALTTLRRFEPATLPLRVYDEAAHLEFRLNFEALPALLIAGGGHVGRELAWQAARLDFRVRVFDDRADMLSPQRFAPPVECIVGPIDEMLAQERIDEHTYIVIVTRGHQRDEQALHAIIHKPARYIGMIGSRRKKKLIFDDLKRLGVTAELLDRVQSPIGLPIGAVTVPEIAISILAQLIEARRQGLRRKAVEGPFTIVSHDFERGDAQRVCV
jgi:xanthine dehydrogenase accessory factor